MALMGDDIYEDEMYPAIERAFWGRYSRGSGQIKPYVWRPHRKTYEIPDFAYIRAYNQIHVVEAKRFAGDVWRALDQLRNYRGNYKYLALPNGEYNNDRESIDENIENLCGLILVFRRGRGLSAKFHADSPKYEGDYSKYYANV